MKILLTSDLKRSIDNGFEDQLTIGSKDSTQQSV